jgi:hypothetical protein
MAAEAYIAFSEDCTYAFVEWTPETDRAVRPWGRSMFG